MRYQRENRGQNHAATERSRKEKTRILFASREEWTLDENVSEESYPRDDEPRGARRRRDAKGLSTKEKLNGVGGKEPSSLIAFLNVQETKEKEVEESIYE